MAFIWQLLGYKDSRRRSLAGNCAAALVSWTGFATSSVTLLIDNIKTKLVKSVEDTLRILREEKAAMVGGVMHCFVEDWDIAQQAMEMGFYISFSGIITFRNAKVLQAVAKQVPLDRLLVETDSPYLAPVPYRGQKNQPAYVKHVAEFIANLREEPVETIAEATTENFFRLFRLTSS